jgi:tRNA pseudouridine55 synthase
VSSWRRRGARRPPAPDPALPAAPVSPLPVGDYVLACDKPGGITSHDVVASVRRALPRGTKVGHAGTLDPFATGLLLVLVGRATRVQRFLMALPKTYEAVAQFGAVSDTGDPDGEITVTGRVPSGDLTLPTGSLMQRPPDYSAVKIGGRRAYALARAGETVTLAPRPIHVHRFEELARDGDRRTFVIECSSGTYVRTLIAELGDAYCAALRRTRVGRFDVAAADPQHPVELPEALSFMPAVTLDAEQQRRAGHGQALTIERVPSAGGLRDGDVARLVGPDGLVALATADLAAGALRPTVGLRG